MEGGRGWRKVNCEAECQQKKQQWECFTDFTTVIVQFEKMELSRSARLCGATASLRSFHFLCPWLHQGRPCQWVLKGWGDSF